jgi:hypothetical protein
MCVIFYTYSDNFGVGIILSLILFSISYFIHVKLNTVGLSTDVKLESIPKAKQLCAELYNQSI